jgi:UDP-GlcNAc:undecaprenyl-phosphate GlcNAc-1-phosphate transferase
MIYFAYFLASFILSAIITPVIKLVAFKFKIIDVPSAPRKLHQNPTALLGGLAIFISFTVLLISYIFFQHPDFNIIPMRFFCGIIIGGLILTVGGLVDDKFNLPPKFLWLFPAVASAIVVWSGIGVGISQITNPFGGSININYTIPFYIFSLQLSAVLVWLWMMGMIFTTKLLDGLDGLCSGIGLIGALTMFAISLTPKINQPITAGLALILAGCLAGYLLYAYNPASIFLGEGGSTFIGFCLGVLSIILGAKIATALLVMGIPILDVAWVIIKRLWYKRSPFKGDRQHLHFKLLDIGLSQRQTVLVLYAISAIFGGVAVFLQSFGKLVALAILTLVMIGIALTTVVLYKKKHPHIPDLFDYAKNQGYYKANGQGFKHIRK